PEEHPWEFELQLGVGDRVEGPFDRMYLREHVYMGRLTGDERIRVPGASTWARLGDRPEFAEILSLLGKEAPAVVGNKRIAGWQKTGGVPSTPGTPGGGPTRPSAARPTPAPARPASPTPADPPADPAPAPGAGGRTKLLAGAAILVVVAVVAGVVLLA
ncbi:MAG: hypothetical protein VX265_16670, partial [Myxococcota bacterium]|nr:hypothetical protein [Myxococcota bacterium]